MKFPHRKVKEEEPEVEDHIQSSPLENRSPMKFTSFIRRPFLVQAVEITPENITQVAKYIGDVRDRDDGTKFILVNPRLVPTGERGITRVYPGYFVTKMGDNYRCFTRQDFKDLFVQHDEHTREPYKIIRYRGLERGER